MFRIVKIPSRSSASWLWLGPAALLPVALVGPNTVIGIYAVAVLAVGLKLLWRPFEPPILIMIFLYQWTQASVAIFYGNFVGASISELASFAGRHEFASVLMITGVLILALSVRTAIGAHNPFLRFHVQTLFCLRPFKFWLRVYLLSWILSAIFQALAQLISGLGPIFLTLSGIKWVVFMLLTCAAFTSPMTTVFRMWTIIFAIELMLSIGGFFASFKDVFFFTLFGVFFVNGRLGRRQLILGTIFIFLMTNFAIVWTAIKPEYRAFVNLGTGQQVLLVDYSERILKLGELVNQIDSQLFQNASNDLIKRLMYYEIFGAVAENIPSTLPYTKGEIWTDAITRPFMPRILFPDKEAINDSDLTNKLTGLNFSSSEQGTSVSIGYMGEAYADFGPIMMFIAIAALGIGIGSFYRWLLRQPGEFSVIGASLSTFALLPAHLVETSIVKLISTLILTFVSCVVVIKFITPTMLGSHSPPGIRNT